MSEQANGHRHKTLESKVQFQALQITSMTLTSHSTSVSYSSLWNEDNHSTLRSIRQYCFIIAKGYNADYYC